MALNRKTLGEVLQRSGIVQPIDFGDVSCELVDVKGSGSVTNVIGVPVVWDEAGSAFNLYVAQAIPTTITGGTPNRAPVGILVGGVEGVGYDPGAVTLSGTATKLTVLFKGDATVKEKGITWGASTDPQKLAFRVALEKQGINIQAAATSVTASQV